MVSADMCEHEWPGSGCPECRKADTEQTGAQADGVGSAFSKMEDEALGLIGRDPASYDPNATERRIERVREEFDNALASSEAARLELVREVDALKAEMRAEPESYPNLLRINREYATRCDNEREAAEARALAAETALAAREVATDAVPVAKFKLGDRVTKTKGSQWTGRIVGTYSTALTPEGYAVESETEKGSVQIYPAAALAASPTLPAPAPEASDA